METGISAPAISSDSSESAASGSAVDARACGAIPPVGRDCRRFRPLVREADLLPGARLVDHARGRPRPAPGARRDLDGVEVGHRSRREAESDAGNHAAAFRDRRAHRVRVGRRAVHHARLGRDRARRNHRLRVRLQTAPSLVAPLRSRLPVDSAAGADHADARAAAPVSRVAHGRGAPPDAQRAGPSRRKRDSTAGARAVRHRGVQRPSVADRAPQHGRAARRARCSRSR